MAQQAQVAPAHVPPAQHASPAPAAHPAAVPPPPVLHEHAGAGTAHSAAADGRAPAPVPGEPAAGAQPGTQNPQGSVRTYYQDAGSRVEELRSRGETQEITVKPAGKMPAYEVVPQNNRTRAAQTSRQNSEGTTGPRRWRIGEF